MLRYIQASYRVVILPGKAKRICAVLCAGQCGPSVDLKEQLLHVTACMQGVEIVAFGKLQCDFGS